MVRKPGQDDFLKTLLFFTFSFNDIVLTSIFFYFFFFFFFFFRSY